jgi:ATP-dependent DNA helicase RecQ
MQEEIILAAEKRRDILALLPTGGGKSLCFQIPVLMQEGIGIVISPLVALMEDQVKALQKKGIKALAITGGISFQELDSLLDNCIYGNYKFLYLSPERLQQDIVQQRIKQMNVNLIAVDEAHCISQWGHDFRPAYLNISILRELKPDVPLWPYSICHRWRSLRILKSNWNSKIRWFTNPHLSAPISRIRS